MHEKRVSVFPPEPMDLGISRRVRNWRKSVLYPPPPFGCYSVVLQTVCARSSDLSRFPVSIDLLFRRGVEEEMKRRSTMRGFVQSRDNTIFTKMLLLKNINKILTYEYLYFFIIITENEILTILWPLLIYLTTVGRSGKVLFSIIEKKKIHYCRGAYSIVTVDSFN